jgi:hypothetical protein
MPAETLFIRNPHEVPFLHDQVKKALALGDEASRSISIEENDDFGFMTVQFLYKQMQRRGNKKRTDSPCPTLA